MDQKFWDKIDSFGQNGEYDKIVREIKKLPADKMDMELINVLGRAYMYLGDLGNALDTYLSFIGKAEEDTLNADIWLYSEAGWTCNEFEDFEQGLKYLLEAEKLGRDDEWLNTEIGQCLGRLERYEEAIKRLEKSLKLIEADEEDGTMGLFFFIGYIPQTKLFEGKVEMTEDGYIKAGEDTRTSVPGVYVAGDCRVKDIRQVVTAVSDGAVAAIRAEKYIAEKFE